MDRFKQTLVMPYPNQERHESNHNYISPHFRRDHKEGIAGNCFGVGRPRVMRQVKNNGPNQPGENQSEDRGYKNQQSIHQVHARIPAGRGNNHRNRR